VARLQLKKLNAQLSELTDQQAAYIGVAKEGWPYKLPTTTATEFLLAAKLLDGFVVDGLLAGIIGSTLYSVISWLLSKLLLSPKS
jgi:hypothetical protein